MESPRPKFADVANILMQLIAQGGGSEALDPLYDLISEHPASTQFTAEQGRDAFIGSGGARCSDHCWWPTPYS